MNVSRPNYFRGRGRGKSRCRQNTDLHFFQVVREGSNKHGRISKNVPRSLSYVLSEQSVNNNSHSLTSGTAGTTFSRPKTTDCTNLSSNIQTVTTHLGPPSMGILSHEPSEGSFTQNFCRTDFQSFKKQHSGLFNEKSGFQNIFYSPTIQSSSIDACNILPSTDFNLDQNDDNVPFQSELQFPDYVDNDCSETYKVQSPNNKNNENFIHSNTHGTIESNNTFCNMFNNNKNFVNSNDLFGNPKLTTHSGCDQNEPLMSKDNVNKWQQVLKKFRSDLGESFSEHCVESHDTDKDNSSKISTPLSNNNPSNVPTKEIIDKQVASSFNDQSEKSDIEFRQPFPPKTVKRKRPVCSNSKKKLQESFPANKIGNRDQKHIYGEVKLLQNQTKLPHHEIREQSCESDSNDSRTPRRLAGLFATPCLTFSSLPSAKDVFLSPNIDTTPNFTSYNTSTTPSHSSKTLNTKKLTSSELDSYHVIAITEGRGTAVGEVGLACIDIVCPKIHLCQISDSQTYMKTLTKINIYNPIELIVPDTFLSCQNTSDLFKAITCKFENVKIVTVKRMYFNDKNGFNVIKQIILPELSSVEITIEKKYYALAAASALLKYVEFHHNVLLPKRSIWIEYNCAKGVAYIDLETAKRLELVTGNTFGTMADRCCLFAVMNKCQTLGGKRRLRTLILQPPCYLSSITKRQEAIDFLVHDPLFLSAMQNILRKLNDVEKLLWLCKKPPNFDREQKTCENLTNFILLLKKTVDEIPSLKCLLGDAQQDFFIRFRESLNVDSIKKMRDIILKTIKEDAKLVKGYSASEMQRCFSIKEKVNDLLDVARVTYSNLIELAQEEVNNLAKTHNLPLRISQSSDRGFHITCSSSKNSSFTEDSLPSCFIQVRMKGNALKFTTKEIFCLNARIVRTSQEIQLITNEILYEMVLELREYVGCLYRLCENIAEVDVLCSLAETSSISGYVKPIFGSNLNLNSARHPILDMLNPTRPIPNNVCASEMCSMSIITGPNMSGKTTYVTMIPLIQIMAQIGCYIPAMKGKLRITNHIAVRKGDIDNMGNGISSFAHEIKEFLYIQQTMTNRSLIIADEIFQGTIPEEGVAMAWAYAEELLTMPAYIFISTHYQYLTNLSKIFNNVTNSHMEVIERKTDDINDYGQLTFTHRVLPGPTSVAHYGLRMINCANLETTFQQDVIEISKQINNKILTAQPLAVLIDSDKLIQFKRIDSIEKFLRKILELIAMNEFTTHIVEGLQQMILEDKFFASNRETPASN